MSMPALVGMLPVLSFLAVLLYLDSYKLVRLCVSSLPSVDVRRGGGGR
jgi:hypothetical protein